MSISVTVSKGGIPYKLLAERVTHSLDRSVTQNGLPSASEGSAGQVFILDLGQVVQTIIVEGLVNVVPNYSGEGDPSKSQLEAAAKTWYVQYSVGGGGETTPASLSIPGGSYSVFFKNASFSLVGGLEDRWQYSILFYVAG